MGLPEPVASSAGSAGGPSSFSLPPLTFSSRLGKTGELVLLATKSFDDPKAGDSLGHQYLLGFFPLTRVFVEHGAERFVEEIFIEKLLNEGHRVAEVSVAQLGHMNLGVPVSAAILPSIEDLSVSAYDAIFFRIADVSATIQLTYLSTENFRPIRQESYSVNEFDYRRQAQAPVLSSMLRRGCGDAAESLLKHMISHRVTRLLSETPLSGAENPPPLWIVLPTFAHPPAPTIGQYLSASYGFASVPPFSASEILRIAQRGLTEEALGEGLHFAALLDSGSDLQTRSVLRTAVERLEIDESNFMILQMGFREEEDGILVRAKTCSLKSPQARGVDGAAVVTLEAAAGALLRAFRNLAPKGEEAEVSCLEEGHALHP